MTGVQTCALPILDEAEACLEKLEAEANRISSQMAKGFNKNDVSLQAAKFDASKQDYQYTVQTFDDLIKLTNQVMDEVDSYADYVNLPEDTYNNEVNGGDPEHYAEMHPCYSETRDSIDSVLDDLEDMKKDFQKGRDAAAKAAGISSDRKSNLKQDKNGSVAKPVAATKASGSSKAAAKQKPKSGASTVTGIVEDQKKRQQKK